MKPKYYITLLKLFRLIIITGLIFVLIMPFVKIFIDAINVSDDPLSQWIPSKVSFSVFSKTAQRIIANDSLLNTIILSTVAMIIQVVSTSLYGYAFAKLKFRGSEIIFWIFMTSLIVPYHVLENSRLYFMVYQTQYITSVYLRVVQLFVFTGLGMGIRSVLFIYIFRQYFRSIPNELIEAAEMDGCNAVKTYWLVMLPNAQGAIITVAIFSFIWQWNDYEYASLFSLAGNGFDTLAGVIVQNRFYGSVNVYGLIIMIPLLVLYIIVQNKFIDSVEKVAIIG